MIEGIKLGIIFATVIEAIHFFTTIYLTKSIAFKNKIFDRLKPLFFFFVILLLLFIIFSGFYVVKTNENVILTKFSGEKEVISNTGLKYSFLGNVENINLQKQIMRFPDYAGYETIITLDNKPLLINSFLEFKIENVHEWGIENKDSNQKLLVLFTSNVKNVIQKSNYDYIRNNLKLLENDVNKEMSKIEQIYGIKVININFQISDTLAVEKAKSDAESQKISSESLKESYTHEAEAIEIKYNSIEDKDFIKYMEFIKAIKEGNVQTIIVPQNSITSYNLEVEK